MTLQKAIGNVRSYQKQVYFRWKNKVRNRLVDYTGFSEQEIIDRYFKGDKEAFKRLEIWEGTEEYANLVLLLIKEQSHNDILDAYNAVAEKARTGDEKAIKTLLLLQKEVKKNLKKKTEVQADDEDDLIIE